MTVYPRSLFGRLALLLLVVIALALAATIARLPPRPRGPPRSCVRRHEDRPATGRPGGARILRRARAPRDRRPDRPGIRRANPSGSGAAAAGPRAADAAANAGARDAAQGSVRLGNAGAHDAGARPPVRSRRCRGLGVLDRLSDAAATLGGRAVAGDRLEPDRSRRFFSSRPTASPATSRVRCATSTPPSSASAAASRRRPCPKAALLRSRRSTAASTG